MNEVECEKCPIAPNCAAYWEAVKDNDNSYHYQNIVRASGYECPLVKLILKPGKKGG